MKYPFIPSWEMPREDISILVWAVEDVYEKRNETYPTF